MEINFPKLEKRILKFWKENNIFEKSIEQRKKAKNFVFYEGPPTANAKPGVHHVLSRVFKDIICRYKTMRGFRVLRKAGWDTHGLPVELEIEKKLGLKSKKDIERYGIDKFNKKCQQSVWEYKKEWEKLTERIAFWLDMKNPYITYTLEYMETVWWIIKQIWQKGLLYEDFKVVPYCPRCQTSLSSHEVALGYKKIKEPAIYVKFKIQNSKFKIKEKTYLLVWTTTPWTLPGNVAIAVNPHFTYAKVKIDPFSEECLILAKERISACQIKGEIIEELKGEKLVGLKYQPLFDFYTPDYQKERIYEVISGEFVSLKEGTGLVHIAPAFGEEDLELIKMQNAKCKMKNEVRFPILLTVNEEGKFTSDVKKWTGLFVKEADPLIIEDLRNRRLLFKEELYEHDYPFCWRCHSPLLYYAKESWFINMQKVKRDLIENNQKINWIPNYLKEGRFGEWLREVRDWTLSRERYWGVPLSIWRCQIGKNQKSKIKNQKSCDNIVVIGSKEDLLKQKFSTNNYFLFRHGHSLRQVINLASSWPEKTPFPLTPKGKKQVLKEAKKLKKEKIDLIFSSDLLRTKETAEILAKETGAKIIFDKRLREVNVGIFNGKDPKLFWDYISKKKNPLLARVPKGESLLALRKRVYDFIREIEERYRGSQKNILIVSHELPLTFLEKTLAGFSLQEIITWRKENRDKLLKPGQWKKIEFKKLPFNENIELDFHRPYIDKVKFYCSQCGNLIERVPEVIDCWFDSGSMPFAQGYWPFAQNQKSKIKNQKLLPPKLFPADYICEGIDQTRGWFYTLLAVSTLLDFGPPYKNVISLGHVLDEKGEKMSKSKGNVVDPWYIIEKYGVDTVRWYFYTINQPGDAKLFSEKDLEGVLKKFIFTLWNCYLFYETYSESAKCKIQNAKLKIKNLLDRWIISKLHGLIEEVSKKLDKYDVTGAGRAIENFVIEDLSLWYIRRSRKRFQKGIGKSGKDFQEACQTLGFVLLTLSKLTAPFIPFLSEQIYQSLCSKSKIKNQKSKTFFPFSVHLSDYPRSDKKLINKKLEEKMIKVREIVALSLAERAKAKIKVRQPLQKLKIKNEKLKIEKELLGLIKEEINVKEIIFDANLQKEIELDTKITPELKEEGIIREIVRHLQEMRKRANLKPRHKIKVYYFGGSELNKILEKNKEVILRETLAKNFQLSQKKEKVFTLNQEIKVDKEKLWLAIKKI